MSKNLLIIFTRNPELGKVKTRLASSVGEKKALEIYKLLLLKTEKTIRNLRCDKAVFYSVEIRRNDIWDNSIYIKHKQQGKDLGKRMQNAFKMAFKQLYDKVVIIGSDLYDLNTDHIELSFKKLNIHDVVIGPAHDGGYYLLGMKSLNSQVFINKAWGEHMVFHDTLNDLRSKSVYLLETLHDVDEYEDLKHVNAFKKYL